MNLVSEKRSHSGLTKSSQETAPSNRTQLMRFHPASFTGKAPRKGSRTPLNKNKYSEQRDEETGYGYFGARYMDHEMMTMWRLSQ